MLRRSLLAGLGATALAPIAPSVHAAESTWPDRPIRMLVGFAPGGTADILARKLQPLLATRFGQSIIVENRSGASGMTAAAEVARSAPDGYTLQLTVSTHASLAAINRKMPYDTERDFAPVVFIGSIPLVLIVNQKSPFKSLAELLAAAKAKPGSINYAFPGIGLSHHLAGELLKQRANVDIQAVSYRGTAPALNDVLAGAVEMTFGTLPAIMGAINGGLVRPLAITALQRAKSLPNVPTMSELGFSGFDVSEWFGIVAPAKTPDGIIVRINSETNVVLRDPELQRWLDENNVIRGATTAEGFRQFISDEIKKFTQIAAKSGISIE